MKPFMKKKTLKASVSLLMCIAILTPLLPDPAFTIKAVDILSEKVSSAAFTEEPSTLPEDSQAGLGYVRLDQENENLDDSQIAVRLFGKDTKAASYSKEEVEQKTQQLQTSRAKSLGISITQFEKAVTLHGGSEVYQQELTALEISKSNSDISEKDQQNILKLINGGYSNSQAFSANIASESLGASIDDLIRYKSEALEEEKEATKQEQIGSLFQESKENTESEKDPEYLKVATNFGVTYNVIEMYAMRNKVSPSKLEQAFNTERQERYPSKDFETAQQRSKVERVKDIT